jgi:hypothetical protein
MFSPWSVSHVSFAMPHGGVPACLYVTAQDVAKARAALSKAELETLAKMKFADHFDGVGRQDDHAGAAAEQNAILQSIAWETVSKYSYAGVVN